MRSVLTTTTFMVLIGVGSLPAQHVMEVVGGSASPGGGFPAVILLSHDAEVQGYTVSLTFDNSVFTLDDVDFAGLQIENLLAPDTVEFFFFQIDNVYDPAFGFGTVSAVFDTGSPFDGQTLPPGDDQEIVRFSFTVAADGSLSGQCAIIHLTNGIGAPQPFNNLMTVNGMSIFPERVDGEVCFAELGFLRGDADGDGSFNGLLDGLKILNFQFAGGGEPPCLEAAETDGDGSFNGLLDGLYALNHQFAGGNPPPAPYPGCGADPDPENTLGCAAPPVNCP